VTPTTPTALERAIQRHGDQLYRLARLLTPDTTSAIALLRAALPRLAATSPDTLTEPTLAAALVAALPPERRRHWPQRLPDWARLPSRHPEAPLLAELARLPRRQRAVLGLVLLEDFEPAQAAGVLAVDETAARALLSDALRQLAPKVHPELPIADLASEDVPEGCRATRAALASGGDLAHADTTIRGHLALCGACRAAEETWQRLIGSVENALRGALRGGAFPAHLHDEVRAMLTQAPTRAPSARLANQHLRLALVAAVVLAIGFALCFCWLSLWVGLKSRSPGGVQGIMFLLIFPLSFGSSAFVSPATMPGWLQAWTKANPITRLVDAMRGLMVGGPVAENVLLTLVWMAALLVVFVPLTLRAYKRRA